MLEKEKTPNRKKKETERATEKHQNAKVAGNVELE